LKLHQAKLNKQAESQKEKGKSETRITFCSTTKGKMQGVPFRMCEHLEQLEHFGTVTIVKLFNY